MKLKSSSGTILIASAALVISAVIITSVTFSQDKKEAKSVDEETVVLDVKGMTCSGCEYMVKKTLTSVDGVVSVEADYENESATVKYSKEKTTPEKLAAALNENTDYEAKAPKAVEKKKTDPDN